MKTSTLGLLAGLLLGIAAGGFGAFLLVLGVLGYLIGGALDGDIDVGALLGGRGRG